jgi:hypothetical protein
VQPATMPALDFALALQTARHATLTLDEGQSLTIQITRCSLDRGT